MRKIRQTRKNKFQKAEDGDRRCFMTGMPLPKENLIRFVVGPDKRLYADLADKLDGRGAWLTASKSLLAQAITKGAFNKAFGEHVTVPEAFSDALAAHMKDRCLHLVGLAKKAGCLIVGFDKVRELNGKEHVAVLIAARDGAEGGTDRLAHVFPDAFAVNDFTSDELGHAIGRDFSVHVALKSCKLAKSFEQEVRRYRAYLATDERGNND